MSDVWDDDSNYDGQVQQNQGTPQGPKALRELHDKDRERINALEAELLALRQERNASKVAEMLESHGIPKGAAKLYQGDADPAAVAAWAEENADLFGAGGTNPAVHKDDAPSVSPMSQQEQDDYQRVIDAGVDGVKPTHFNDAMAALMAATTREELQDVYRRFG